MAVKTLVTKAEDVPDFDAMTDEEMTDWLETHEIDADLQLELFEVSVRGERVDVASR